MRVGEAVCVVSAGSDVDGWCLAHEVVVVHAFPALAGTDPGQDFGQSAVDAGVDERGAGGVVFPAGDGDGSGIACGVVIEGTVGNAAVFDVRGHGTILRNPAAGAAASCVQPRRLTPDQKDPIEI